MTWTQGLWRQQLAGILISVFVDIIIASVAAHYLSGPYESTWTIFLIVFLGFYAVAFALWLWKTIRGWIVFAFLRRRAAVRIASQLSARGLPRPEPRDYSAEMYFIRLGDDEEAEPKVRIAAAMELAAMKYPMQAGRGMEAWRLGLLFDDAIEEMRRL